MDTEKFDAALRALVARQGPAIGPSPIDVSIRLNQPMDNGQAQQMQELGIDSADTRRRVFFARLPIAKLQGIAAKTWVQQISLSQTMQPKPQDE